MRETSRVDAIYETLRDRISLGDYQPGDMFHEAALGQEFDVSRTPIRQVLQRLAFEKLAVVRSGVGTMVAAQPEELVRHCLEMHARMLAGFGELRLAEIPPEAEELVELLRARAARLEETPEPERLWRLLKTLQTLRDLLLRDDLMRHLNELLFYRCAPTLMRAARARPELARDTLLPSVRTMFAPLDQRDPATFFALQAAATRRCVDLLAAAETAVVPAAPAGAGQEAGARG